jgi:uncharacterized membrane protein HdeD (DUF308 family)
MHGILAPLRQFVRFAKPWQRILAGAILAVIGLFTGLYVVTAVGVVLVVLPIAAWVRGRRESGEAETTGGVPAVKPADRA